MLQTKHGRTLGFGISGVGDLSGFSGAFLTFTGGGAVVAGAGAESTRSFSMVHLLPLLCWFLSC